MKNKLIFGYDIMTYNGEIPNCLNPKFLSTIHIASDFDYSMSGEFFSKRWNCDWPVYNSNFYEKVSTKKSISQIKEDRRNNINYDWFYIIEPFAIDKKCLNSLLEFLPAPSAILEGTETAALLN